MAQPSGESCPFLVPVDADRLWLYPTGVYCRRPDARVRVPAPTTLAQVCSTPGHRNCPGFRVAIAGSARDADRDHA